MSEQLWLATLSADQLAQLLTPPRTAAPFAILERLTALDFPAPDEAIDVTAWQRGSVFGATYELRWERRGADFRAWLLGEAALPGFETVWPNVAGPLAERPGDGQCYLWGPDDPRVARPPQYRALGPGQGRPVLFRREYRRANGVLAAYRLTGMAWEG